jgi:hypothetical protein
MARPNLGIQPIEEITVIDEAKHLFDVEETNFSHNREADLLITHSGVDGEDAVANHMVRLVVGNDVAADSTWFFNNTATPTNPFTLSGIPLPTRLRAICDDAAGAKIKVRRIIRHKGKIDPY